MADNTPDVIPEVEPEAYPEEVIVISVLGPQFGFHYVSREEAARKGEEYETASDQIEYFLTELNPENQEVALNLLIGLIDLEATNELQSSVNSSALTFIFNLSKKIVVDRIINDKSFLNLLVDALKSREIYDTVYQMINYEYLGAEIVIRILTQLAGEEENPFLEDKDYEA